MFTVSSIIFQYPTIVGFFFFKLQDSCTCRSSMNNKICFLIYQRRVNFRWTLHRQLTTVIGQDVLLYPLPISHPKLPNLMLTQYMVLGQEEYTKRCTLLLQKSTLNPICKYREYSKNHKNLIILYLIIILSMPS